MKRQLQQMLLITLFLWYATDSWGEGMIYKCKDQEGAYIYQKSACNGNADTVSSWTPKKSSAIIEEDPAKKDNKKAEPVILKIKQAPNGHYAAEGSINDKTINFVVDTGASFVSLPENLAHGALIYCDNKVQIDTANGTVDSCTAKIKTLKFGPFIMQDVVAVIQPNLGQPLLGMNVLQMFKIEQNSGEMQISVIEKPKAEAN